MLLYFILFLNSYHCCVYVLTWQVSADVRNRLENVQEETKELTLVCCMDVILESLCLYLKW